MIFLRSFSPVALRLVFATVAFLFFFGARAQTVQEYQIGAAQDYLGIASGNDGNLWFSEYTPSKIGIYKPGGTVIRFNTPSSDSGPSGMILGPDNKIWFLEKHAVASVNYSDFSISEFPTSTLCQGNSALTKDSTALWYAEECTDGFGKANEDILKITPAGSLSRYPIGTGVSRQIYSVVNGPDNNIWFAEYAGNAIGRLNKRTMTFAEFSIPTLASRPYELVVGPDSNLWFFENSGGNLARIDTDGVIKEFAWPDLMPESMILGPDGNLWSIDDNQHVWRIAVHSGSIDLTRILSKEHDIGVSTITTGSDGNLWFTEEKGSALGTIRMDGIFVDDFEGDPSP